jgi:glycosyltransferase involved in cell wall biosynthesis
VATGIDRPKLLLLVTLGDWGGAPRVVYELANRFSGEYDVSVACPPGGMLVPRLTRAGVRVIPVPSLCRAPLPWRDVPALARLVRVMRRERFDIVHAHSTKAGLLGRVAARLAGVPVIVFTAHGWPFAVGRAWWRRWPFLLAEWVGGRLSTRVVCVSRHDGEQARRLRIVPRGRLAVIRNGVDPAYVSSSVERGAPATRSVPVLTFVGRLAPQKDPLCLLEAVRGLSLGSLLMIGEGPLRREIHERIRRHALAGRVTLMDPRPDIPDVLAASDIFVLPSRWEGLPLAIIEAMMAGLPVVATRVGGVPELVEDGVTGFLVPPGDPKALAAALERLASNAGLRRRMGAAGRAKALREFRLERMLSETARLYQDLLAASRETTSAGSLADRLIRTGHDVTLPSAPSHRS